MGSNHLRVDRLLDPDTNADAEPGNNPDTDANSYSHAYPFHSNPDANTNPDSDTHPNADANTNPNSHAYPDTNSNPDTDSHTDANTNPNSHTDANTNSIASGAGRQPLDSDASSDRR
jgi:hypothetical protein